MQSSGHLGTLRMGASASATAYSVPVYRSARGGESAVYRSALSPSTLLTSADGVTTLHENFQLGLRIARDRPCLGERRGAGGAGPLGEFTWLTYGEVWQRAQAVGSALAARGYRRGTPVGLYSRNCPAWVLVEQACNAYSLLTVPLYDTLGTDAVQYILSVTAMPVVACTRDKLETLLAAARTLGTLRTVIEMDPAADSPPERVVQGVLVLRLDALARAAGPAVLLPVDPPAPSDVATIVFTSGTTSLPKGVVLTHACFAAAMAAAAASGVDLTEQDVHVSYLPLAHVFERIVQVCVLHRGAAIGFFSGDVQRLLEDMSVLQPTLFPSVPRLYNRVYDKIMAGLADAPAPRRALFEFALASKLHYLRTGGDTTHALYDKLIFSKLRALLGGRVRLMITGSAPLAQNVKEFFQVAFSCPMLEGYGLSETTGIATITLPSARALPGVGSVAPSCELKLVDIPEMGYRSTDTPYPRGEICLRGPNVFVGYYKAPEQTAEAIDTDGWFHTGDVGHVTSEGIIAITDRKKAIFKLSQGEYVAPEKIEGAYARCPFVAQVFVHGDSLKSCLIGILVVDTEVAARWAAEHGIKGPAAQPAALCTNATFLKDVQSAMSAAAAAGGLKGFEHIKAFHLIAEPFSVENGLLTPTFKLKRQELKLRFAAELAALYTKLGE